MTEPDAALPNGTVFGRYQIGARVHAGSMSCVYRAEDRESAQVVALKRPAKDDPGSLARFLGEARIHHGLNHPAIVRQLGHGGTSFADAHIAMEWLDGQTLEECLASGPLGLLDAVTMARRVAEALSLVHSEHVVHRDIKPANLILCDGLPERTKLIDFGIARRESARGLREHASFAGGSWAYMSPEQAMGSAELGARADVYALGCVLFEAISGSPAFPNDRAQAVLAKVWRPAPNLAEHCEGLPKSLATLVSRMLATDPSQRPENGSALASELRLLGKFPNTRAKRRARD
jgi:eukaryotic-like serine/threonine-protein kinase